MGAINTRYKGDMGVTEHCPVHETMATLEGVEFEVVGK